MSRRIGADHVVRLEHDLRHQVSTIGALASLISTSPDIGDQARWRSIQLLTELTWLDELIDSIALGSDEDSDAPHVAVEDLVRGVVEAVSAVSPTRISVDVSPATAAISRVDLWRALRNLVMNAVEAAGRNGQVAVAAHEEEDGVVISIDDNGPGFTAREADVAARRGLQIVREIAAGANGRIEVGVSQLGGCRAQLHLPCVTRADS